MNRSQGTKRARSQQESKSEHASRKLCESKPGSETISPLDKKRARSEEVDLEIVEPPVKKLCGASEHPQATEVPANANTDDLFEAESGQDESIAAHTPISSDLSLTLSIVAQVREESDDEANSNDSCEDLDGEEPIGPLTAYKPDLDFDAELEAALEETSDSGSESNEVRNDEPGEEGGFGDDFEAELDAAFEDDPEASIQPKIDGSLCLDKTGSAQAGKSLAEPDTPQSKASATEESPSPQTSSSTTPSTGRSQSSPRTVNSTTSTPDRPSVSRRGNAAVVSFKDRRPPTAEDRMLVANAISWTYTDLYKRTGIYLDSKTPNSDFRSEEIYDTRNESFSYQYGFVQHRYKSYMEVQDSKLGIDTATKAYQKKARRKYEEEDLLDEVEGEWKSFADWGPPKPKKPVETVQPKETVDLTKE